MIRIDRGPEPAQLIRARRRRLARQILARCRGTPPPIDGYACVRGDLYRALGGKCVFCERHTGEKASPVEHFRPKDGADRDETRPVPATRDGDCYWWLAWSWENLLFACHTCNTGYKRNWFPLMPGTQPLPRPPTGAADDPPAACYDLSLESPVLIDMGREDPLAHIEWRPENPRERPELLRWRPFHKTERGRRTIEILGLRQHLVVHVNTHIRQAVLGPLQALWRECDRGDVGRMRELWTDLLLRLFPHAAAYHAASYDALRFLVPRWFREQYGLSEVPHPGARQATAPPGPIFVDVPLMAALPAELRLEIRARSLTKRDLRERLQQLRAWTEAELAELLGDHSMDPNEEEP